MLARRPIALLRGGAPRALLLGWFTTPVAAGGGVPRRSYSDRDRYSAFDKAFDADELKAARAWRAAFDHPDRLPRGTTTFARSSGPGGQHVNKTETKATTAWTVSELAKDARLPALVQAKLRASRYYTRATDSLTFQAQGTRSRTANSAANRQKLYDELVALYEAAVPGASRPETASKYKQVAKNFHAARLNDKAKQSAKKQSRRGRFDD